MFESRQGYGWAFESLVLEPDWLQTELGMSRDELVPWLDFAAFVQLYEVRRTIAGVLYEQRLHGPGGTELQRAYYSGTMSLLTGVRHPESSYLADASDHLAGIRIDRRPRGVEVMPYALARASYVTPSQPHTGR